MTTTSINSVASTDSRCQSGTKDLIAFRPHGWWNLTFVVSMLSLALGSFVQSAIHRGVLWSPPLNGGDEDDYERLGYNLAAGLGFGYCPVDSEIRAGLSEPQPTESCERRCTPVEFAPTAYRPPGFPLLVAAVYRISPLNYFVVRLLNCVCCAVAVAIVALVFARRISLTSGVCVGVLCSLDPRFREFAGTFLTENLATLSLSCFAISFARFFQRPTALAALISGLALSALVVTRSFYVAWYPFLWISVACVIWKGFRYTELSGKSGLRRLVLFGTASLLLTGPWWLRNCLLLDALMPTGTQGGIGIADGFSDSAVANFGSWTPTTANRIAAEMYLEPKWQNAAAIVFEKEHCRRGAAQAKQWIREHPRQLVPLSWWKLSRLWESDSALHAGLFSCMFLGLFRARSHSLAHVMWLLLILNSATVMATYHTYERFMTPFRPLIHGFVGCGLEWIALLLLSLWRGKHQPR